MLEPLSTPNVKLINKYFNYINAIYNLFIKVKIIIILGIDIKC